MARPLLDRRRGRATRLRGTYAPTLSEIALLAGTLGLFAALLRIYVRYLPVISLFETRHDEHEDRPEAAK